MLQMTSRDFPDKETHVSFKGRVAVVTGAASGMGKMSAIRLANQGAEVAAVNLDEAGLRETAQGQYMCIPVMSPIETRLKLLQGK